jgi:Asp-tRNA(Asn)/Glu-tRNA(Gln) amidotransferase A subunit family amidase
VIELNFHRANLPISHQQDAAGPIARSVTDVAILLGIMQSPQTDYTPLLQRGALQGKRIGRDDRFFDNYAFYAAAFLGTKRRSPSPITRSM